MRTPMPNPAFDYAPPANPWLDVVHQDDDILVLNKPSGLLSVPGKAPEHADCLEARAKAAFPEARIVHRLDMDTSGIIVLAMNAAAHRHLGLQFERRKTEKTYIADIWGQPTEDQGEINLPLRCDWPNRPKQMVCFEHGRSALTRWEVAERSRHSCRVVLRPFTGRSHQLRVHMQTLGHPILGDRFYATGEALVASHRLNLHAAELFLHHPADGSWVRFASECPF